MSWQLTYPISKVLIPGDKLSSRMNSQESEMFLTGILKSGASTPDASLGWSSLTLSIMHFAMAGSLRLQVLIVEATIFKILLVFWWYHTPQQSKSKIKKEAKTFVFFFLLFSLSFRPNIEKCKLAKQAKVTFGFISFKQKEKNLLV